MKLTTKIIKLGTALLAIRINLNGTEVWGRFIDDKITAEQQFNTVKSLFTANKDVTVEIDYIPIEGNKNVNITSFKEVVNGKPEQAKTVEPKAKPVTNTAVNAQKPPSKPAYKKNDTQTSIERQVASKVAAEAVQVLAGHVTPDNLDVLVKAYEMMFDSAIKKIQG